MAVLATRPLRSAVASIDPKLLIGDKIQPGHALFGVVWINPERVSGAPCFFRTRVPIKNLFDTVADGGTIVDSGAIYPATRSRPRVTCVGRS